MTPAGKIQVRNELTLESGEHSKVQYKGTPQTSYHARRCANIDSSLQRLVCIPILAQRATLSFILATVISTLMTTVTIVHLRNSAQSLEDEPVSDFTFTDSPRKRNDPKTNEDLYSDHSSI